MDRLWRAARPLCQADGRRQIHLGVDAAVANVHNDRRDRHHNGRNCMFSHIMVGSNDLDRSKTFYDAALGALGIPAASLDGGRLFYRHEGGALGVTPPLNGEPATAANGGTIGFTCASPDLVEAWHAAGVANGGTTCEDPPGLRDFGAMKLYLAYLRDPDGNKLCAVHWMS